MSDHAHEHGPHHPHTAPPSDIELRVRALESLLTDKGLVDPAALDALIDTYETKVGPRNGAKVEAGDGRDLQHRCQDPARDRVCALVGQCRARGQPLYPI